MDKHFHRAVVLIEQSRYDLAEPELRLALAEDADDGAAHAYLALCLSRREAFDEATEEARTAIHLAPDVPFMHYVLAQVLFSRNRFDDAERAIGEALRLDPGEAAYYAVLANIRLARREWLPALEAAEQGLQQDAEHVACNNLRALALTQLGRTEEARATVAATPLARDPEDPMSHANLGWNYLHEGKTQQALEHFREALRLDPEMEFARLGLVEALKARHLVYGLILRYFLWMARLSGRAQWAVVIGAFLGYQFLADLAERQPDWAPWLRPILLAYLAFALSTWIASPLFNLLLRLNRFGRYALSRDQRLGSTCVGLLLIPALLALTVWLATDSGLAWLGMVYFGLLLLPVSAIFNCDRGWPRWCMTCYTLILAALVPAFFVLAVVNRPLAKLALQAFIWGSLLSGFVANFLVSAVARH